MRGRGHGIRKVTPKFLPRATQDASFPPGGGGLREGGKNIDDHLFDTGVVQLMGDSISATAFIQGDFTKERART